jgi:predicted nucleotidyltransferase
MHPSDWYLSVDSKKDNLVFPINDDLDISGWDIRKALLLLSKSNASIFEWMQSPIVYRSEPMFLTYLKDLTAHYFNPRAMGHHYLGLGKKALQTGKVGDQFKIKKYFYVLRPLLATMWLVDYQRIPPMEFSKLCSVIKDGDILRAIDRLLMEKYKAHEGKLIRPVPEMEAFIQQEFERCESAVRLFPNNQQTVQAANDVFNALWYVNLTSF